MCWRARVSSAAEKMTVFSERNIPGAAKPQTSVGILLYCAYIFFLSAGDTEATLPLNVS